MQSSRDQIKTTYSIKNAMDLRVEIETAEAKVINALLSEFKFQRKNSLNSIVSQWNFHNTPFDIGNVRVQIQDLNGLISLNTTDKQLLYDLLVKFNIEDADKNEFIDSLADWKDDDDLRHLSGAERNYYETLNKMGPRNGYLQSIAEVNYIRKSEVLNKSQWNKYFTIEHTSGFNPSRSPEMILKAFVKDDTKVAKLIELRDNAQLDENSFYSIVAEDSSEFISFLSGNTFYVKLVAEAEKQKITKKMTIKLRSRSITRPVVITNVMWNINEN